MIDLPTLEEKRHWICGEYGLPRTYEQEFHSSWKVKRGNAYVYMAHSEASPEQLTRMQQIHEWLEEQGFLHILPLIHTKYGERYVYWHGDGFYVTPWIQDSVSVKYRNDWEQMMLGVMGNMHRLSEGFPLCQRQTRAMNTSAIRQRWEDRLQEARTMLAGLNRRDFLPPIERLFVQYCDYLFRLAEGAISHLQSWEDTFGQTKLRRVICHGQVERRNVICDKNQVYITKFDTARIDYPIRDIVLFIRRHMDRIPNSDGHLAARWFHHYTQYFPLIEPERLLMAIYLLFPHAVFEVIHAYRQGKMKSSSLRQARIFKRKLETVFKHEQLVRYLLQHNKQARVHHMERKSVP